MNTFSRLSLFTLVCLGLAFAFWYITDVHAQTPGLQVSGDTGRDQIYNIGDEVRTTFAATIGGQPDKTAVLTINHRGLTGTNYANGAKVKVSEILGTVTVTGKINVLSGAYIEAIWEAKDQQARADFRGIDDPAPVLIVVKAPGPPEADFGNLKIGDTFTQEITIENRDTRRSTLPLTAWQMDIVFNPLILAVAKNEDGSPAIELGDVLGASAHSIGPMASSGKISVSQSRAGQSPLGVILAPGAKKTLLTIEFEVLAVAEEALGIHNVQLQSSSDKNRDQTLDRISYSILVSDVFVATHKSPVREDVNQDLKVDILDVVMVAFNIGKIPYNPRADVNGDGFVNVLDLAAIYASPEWGKTKTKKEVNDKNKSALEAPPMSRNVDSATIQVWIDLARVEDDGSAIFDLGIANLEALLGSSIPAKTRLLLNYPNPFNPETWIPYQLAKAAKVTVTIHAMNGSLIRTLTLGHQAAGIYQSKSQAAYWDGRNELGEQVASGLYFYTLTAGNFSATGKMLVRK